MRLELLIADIWSRDILPFSNMPHRTRSELRRRNSTSTMMRKMSLSRRSSTSRISQRIGEGGSLRALRRPGRGLAEGLVTSGDNKQTKPEAPKHFPSSGTTKQSLQQISEPLEPMLIEGCEFSEKDGLSDVVSIGPGPEEKASETAILWMSDANSLDLTKSRPSIKSIHSFSKESKENVCHSTHQTVESNNRGWGRVGSLRGDNKGHGFRSLFR